MKKSLVRLKIADCVMLVVVLLTSTLPYISGLGFYSDDWAYQATLAQNNGQQWGTMLRELEASDPTLKVRPVQAAFLVTEFKIFGRNPLAYHITGALIIVAATVLLYLVIHEFGVERGLALAIAFVFGLSPTYSTDKFWVSSQQAGLSMAFAFFGIFAILRSNQAEERHPKKWTVLAGIALILSILSYEIAIGLIAASLATIGWRRYRDARTTPAKSVQGLGGIAGVAMVLLTVGVVKAATQTRMALPRHWSFLSRIGSLSQHASMEALRFNLWTYGLCLPWKVFLLYRHSALSAPALGIGSAAAVCVAVYFWQTMRSSATPSARASLWMVFAGFVIFALGYALFFPYQSTTFSTPGVDNRITIGSAVGAACALVGTLCLVCSSLPGHIMRRRIFSIVLGAICGMSCLVVSGIGSYWTTAALAQTEILQSISSNSRSIPHGSVLLLDGFCKYRGPGVVYETDWDTSGAIQLALKDSSLVGDVVSSDANFGLSAVNTAIYGDSEGHYPYGDHLFAYNVEHNLLRGLPSQEAATGYWLAMHPTGTNSCPPAREGGGARIF